MAVVVKNLLEERKVRALEQIARCLSVIEECLLKVVDGNEAAVRTKDIFQQTFVSTVCRQCGMSPRNTVHHKKTQYGYHEYVNPQE